MTQNLGSVDEPLKMAGEQWVLEPRTDDPSNPESGECWIREDLNDGDRVATLVFGDGAEVPLYPLDTAEETVREAVRLHLDGQTVYAPIIPVDDSAYPSHRRQHDGEVFGLHDAMKPLAIPDSVVSRTGDNNDNPTSNRRGLRMETTELWTEIGARISANSSGYQTAEVWRDSDETLIGSKDVSDLSAGDSFTIDLDESLQSGDVFSFVLYNGGNSWTVGQYDENDQFPYESNDGVLKITEATFDLYNDGVDQDSSYSFVDIGNVGFD